MDINAIDEGFFPSSEPDHLLRKLPSTVAVALANTDDWLTKAQGVTGLDKGSTQDVMPMSPAHNCISGLNLGKVPLPE